MSTTLCRQLRLLEGEAMPAPMNSAVADLPLSRFVPVAVNMRMQAAGGSAIQITTVRLVPKVAE